MMNGGSFGLFLFIVQPSSFSIGFSVKGDGQGPAGGVVAVFAQIEALPGSQV
jgi:hypothetical protein